MANSFEKPPIEEPGKLPEEEKKEELTSVEKPAIEKPDLETRRQQELDAYWDAVLKQIPSEYKEAEKQRQEERNQQLKDEYNASIKVIDKYESLSEKEFHKWIDTPEYRDLFEIMDRGIMKPMGVLFKDGEFSVKGKDWLLDYYENSLEDTPIGINAKYDAELTKFGTQLQNNKNQENLNLVLTKEGSFNIVFKEEIFSGETKGIENTVDITEDDTYVYVSSIELASALKGKGYGQAIYIKLNNYAKSKGKILHSDKGQSMTGASANVWNALIKKGIAIKIADNEYRFKYDAEKLNTEVKKEAEKK